MNYQDEIEKILNDHRESVDDYFGNTYLMISENDFPEIAEEIIKLFDNNKNGSTNKS